uniref:Uncharacterized protein n=1 Tax=Anguilla anguilla TaxID=7936 RepID=A0A0E9WJ51_ANGAN
MNYPSHTHLCTITTSHNGVVQMKNIHRVSDQILNIRSIICTILRNHIYMYKHYHGGGGRKQTPFSVAGTCLIQSGLHAAAQTTQTRV